MYVVDTFVFVYITFCCNETVHSVVSNVFVVYLCASVSPSPLMELPPLSPGIHDNVIDVVVVLVTVRRGWSGGTVGMRKKQKVHCTVSIHIILLHVVLSKHFPVL